MNIVFGPVPSRRLGRSLGINNIPPKHCSYSCLYCQVGKTSQTEIAPQDFYPPKHILKTVKNRLSILGPQETVDYLTFVPDGEPTLDRNLGASIALLRELNIKVAVISNASLVWREDVREALKLADWVSLKIDSVDADDWRRINRPDPQLSLQAILAAIRSFADEFEGFLATETMLLEDVNTAAEPINRLADYLAQLKPDKAYLAIPTRPTAEANMLPPDASRLNAIYQTVKTHLDDIELLTGYEGNVFAAGDDPVEDLLAITSVHPMRSDAIQALLTQTQSDWRLVEELVRQNRLRELHYQGKIYYLRAYRQT